MFIATICGTRAAHPLAGVLPHDTFERDCCGSLRRVSAVDRFYRLGKFALQTFHC